MPLGFVTKCRAQAVSMMRQSQGAMRLLLRVQAARQKLEATPAEADRTAWTVQCIAGLMAQALPGAARMAPAEPPAPPAPTPQAEEPAPDRTAEADMNALVYPRCAARIRILGGLPETLMAELDPASDLPATELAHTIATGTHRSLHTSDTRPAA
jgi:hypothetical protein